MADQRVAYVLAGALNTAAGLTAFVVLQLALPYLLALTTAYALVLPLGFLLQRRWVFRVGGPWRAPFARYTGVQASALALNAVLLPALVEVVDAPVVPAQVVSLGLVVVASYLAHSRFTFRAART